MAKEKTKKESSDREILKKELKDHICLAMTEMERAKAILKSLTNDGHECDYTNFTQLNDHVIHLKSQIEKFEDAWFKGE